MNQDAARVVQVLRALAGSADLAGAAATLCTELAAALGAARVVLGWRMKRRAPTRPLAMSGAGVPEWDAETLRGLMAVLDEAVDQGQTLMVPAAVGARWVVRAHETWCRRYALGAAITVPLAVQGQAVGAVLVEFEREAPAQALGLLEQIVAATTPWLVLLESQKVPWWGALAQRWRQTGVRTRTVVLVVAGALALAALVPRPVSIRAPARIEGEWQRPVVAPVRGYLKSVAVQPGDEVEQDQVLAELGDRDLELEHARLSSELAQHAAAVRQAMAQGDRPAMAIEQARHDEVAASLALVAVQREQIRVRAPVAGVVIEGDLAQQVGAPIDRGATLFVVAPPQRFRVVIELDERDLAQVALQQTGRVRLSALPWDNVAVQVTRIAPAASVQEGRHVFEVQARLTEPMAGLRPGQRGTALLEVGRAPWLVHATRRGLDALARLFWRWGP